MSLIKSKENLNQYLLVAFSFFFPLSVFMGNLILSLIVFLWFFSGSLKSKIKEVFQNRLAILSIIFFSVHVLGLFWTEDLEWGLKIVKKMIDFLIFLPILTTITRKDWIHRYIYAFLLAMFISEVLSYLVWFEIVPPFHTALVDNPVPTMSHISYNPFLTIAIYLMIFLTYFSKNISMPLKIILSTMLIPFTITMFITNGRGGQIMFFVMITLTMLQIFGYKNIKAYLMIFLILPTIFIGAYSLSEGFQNRVDQTKHNLEIFYKDDFTDSSVGQRLTWLGNSVQIIKENPIFGVGTGDFPKEYERIHQELTPNSKITVNPHNMYILVLTQTGLIGLISLLSIFVYQIRFAIRSNDIIQQKLGIVLPVLFIVIMFSESYLLGHFTTTLFIFLSSFLYKNFEKN